MREAINRWSCKLSGRRSVAVVIKQPSELRALPRLSDHITPPSDPYSRFFKIIIEDAVSIRSLRVFSSACSSLDVVPASQQDLA